MIHKIAFLFLVISIISCSAPKVKTKTVTFEITNDSTNVIYKNRLHCPVFTKIENIKTGDLEIVQSEANTKIVVMKTATQEDDSTSIQKKYKFSHYYGYFEKKKAAYDTTFNYALPFPKGKRYKIIQGYHGSFSHNTDFSRYAIDFDLQIGDTITAARSGIVIKVVEKHNKQGSTKKFRPYGNYLMIYHGDNTFAQYVHLKQHGSFVKVGDSIKMNQPIAISGFTGLSTTPHLHFGIFKPTSNGFVSIPILLDSIPGKNYKKNKIAVND